MHHQQEHPGQDHRLRAGHQARPQRVGEDLHGDRRVRGARDCGARTCRLLHRHVGHRRPRLRPPVRPLALRRLIRRGDAEERQELRLVLRRGRLQERERGGQGLHPQAAGQEEGDPDDGARVSAALLADRRPQPQDARDRQEQILRDPGEDPAEVRQLERLCAAHGPHVRVQQPPQAADGEVQDAGGQTTFDKSF